MISAPNLDMIEWEIQASFDKAQTEPDTGRVYNMLQFCLSGDALDTESHGDKVKIIGILFAHPESEIVKKEIIPKIGSYHFRSSGYTNFYWAGYGAFWPPGHYSDQRKVLELDGTDWLYSDIAFNECRKQIENQTTWKYSGDTDLILCTARRKPETGKAGMDFSECIVCQLEQHLEAKGDHSISSFFEKIFRYAETSRNPSVYKFSDLHLLNTSKESLLDWVLKIVKMDGYFNKNKNLCIRDISKKSE